MRSDKSSRRSKERLNAESAPPQPSLAGRLRPILERHSLLFAIALVAIASFRIAGTYWVYSHTADEPAHIACGMEWLDRGTYRYETQHPPLARIFTALGPYLLGRRSQGEAPDLSFPNGTDEDFAPRFRRMMVSGFGVLYQGRRYDETLAAARAGILPFFWLACAVVYFWAKRDFGAPTGVLALFLFTLLPPVLAHAGLATTDMALTATLGAAFLSARIWLERPTAKTGVVFGFCGALAILSKFSSLVFFPAIAGASLLLFLGSGAFPASRIGPAIRDRLPSFAIAAAVVCLTAWAAYRFSFGPAHFAHLRVPAPEFFLGLFEVETHNARGHVAYLLGELSQNGFWYYYLVVLAVKTPFGFLVLAIAGIVLALRSGSHRLLARIPIAFTAGILLVGAFSRINIGVRHILPVYLALSILAAIALWRALDQPAGRQWIPATAIVLTAWMSVASAASHPDYLPYFNELAGSHPENILVDSDLDWGQDGKRLQKRLAAAGATSLAFLPIAPGFLHEEQGFPPVRPGDPAGPYPGWNAVSITIWKTLWKISSAARNGVSWPDVVPPQERVGKGILLYYFPPSATAPR